MFGPTIKGAFKGGAKAVKVVNKVAKSGKAISKTAEAGKAASEIAKISKAVDKVAKSTKVLSKASETGKAVSKVVESSKAVDKVAKSGKVLSKASETGKAASKVVESSKGVDKVAKSSKVLSKATETGEATSKVVKNGEITGKIFKNGKVTKSGSKRVETFTTSYSKTNTANLRKVGYQQHHIIPKAKEFSKHDFIIRCKFNVESKINKMFLPSKKGIHPFRSIHRGPPDLEAKERLMRLLNEAERIAIKEKWSVEECMEHLVNKIIKVEKRGLKAGNLHLNIAQFI